MRAACRVSAASFFRAMMPDLSGFLAELAAEIAASSRLLLAESVSVVSLEIEPNFFAWQETEAAH